MANIKFQFQDGAVKSRFIFSKQPYFILQMSEKYLNKQTFITFLFQKIDFVWLLQKPKASLTNARFLIGQRRLFYALIIKAL